MRKKTATRLISGLFLTTVSALLLAGPFFFFDTLSARRTDGEIAPPSKEKPMTESEGILDPERINADDPVAECDAAIRKNRLYQEALDILKPWTLRPEIDAPSLSRGVTLVTQCLNRLNRIDEFDDYIDAVAEAHSENWSLLRVCADLYAGTRHRGTIRDGRFIRGSSSGRDVSTAERDRVRALQLYAQAAERLEKALAEEKATPDEAFFFWRGYAEAFESDRPAWRLQILTDWSALPEPDEADLYDRSRTDAPVDAEGNPVFFAVPESFETAQNDGQRWRFLLHKGAEACPKHACEIDLLLAEWLQRQFGVATLNDYHYFFRDETETDDATPAADGVWSLDTLSDDETIARLANGIKRFKLPDEQNYLKFYQNAYENGNPDQKYRAGLALANVYRNRRQYDKAAAVYKALIPYETEQKNRGRTAADAYRQITGNWGAFEPLRSKAAGSETSVTWKFRNARRTTFVVQEVRVPLLLDDIKAYLKKNEKAPIQKLDYDQLEPERIGWRLMNDEKAKGKYLGEKRAEWSVDLEPDEGHRTKAVDVPLPVAEPGAYLVTAQTDDGNDDAILVWLNDTALIKKRLDDANLWYVADAATGEPVQNAKLDFFGFATYRKGNGGKRSLSVKTASYTDETDAEGLCVQKERAADADDSSNWQWLVTVNAPDAAGKDRFAFFGFKNFWYSSRDDSRYQNDRAYFISDRPVYRPGDAIDYKLWVGRAQYDLPETWQWANQTVYLTVTDPTGTKITDRPITLDDAGGFTDKLETAADARLGHYSFLITKTKNGEWLGMGEVCLEEYKKPEYEVTIDSPADPVKLGEKFKATIAARYYFGSPVVQAKVKYTVTRTKKTNVWYPVRPWDWFYGNGYGWLAADADWYPGWSRWGIARPLPPWRPFLQQEVPEVVAQDEVEIGPDGTVEVQIDSSPAAALFPGADQEYKIEAEVVDRSRRTVIGSGRVLVASKPFKIYCWTDRGFVEPKEQVALSIQTRRVDDKPVAGDARVQIFQIRYETDDDGAVRPIETEVGGESLALDADGVGTWRFQAGEPGQYRLAVTMTDSSGQEVVGGTLLSVRSNAAASPDVFRNGPLEIIPEKAEYVAGETVRLSLNTDAADGTILLFLRSVEGVCGRPVVLRPNGTQTTFEFPLTDTDSPNIFVEALTVRDGRFYEQQREIPVVPEKRVVNVEVVPSQKNYLPGGKGEAKIKLTDVNGKPIAGEIVAAVYDRSVEYISGGSNVPDVKGFFWDWKRSSSPQREDNLESLSTPLDWKDKETMMPLGLFDDGGVRIGVRSNGGREPMMTHRTKSKILPNGEVISYSVTAEESAADASNGMKMMGEPAMAPAMAMGADSMADNVTAAAADPSALAEPTVRQNFADTALWVGRLKTDADGCADIPLDMPENLTTWKIRVWSFAPGTRVGEGTAEVITRKDLIVRMQRPRFLTQTDTVTLSANVHNYLTEEKKIAVSLEIAPEAKGADDSGASILELIGGDLVREVTIPAGGETRVDWQVKADKIGDAPLVMKAITDTESDAVAETLPVQIHGILKREAASGMIARGEKADGQEYAESSVTMTVPAERLPEQTKLTVRFSPTLAGAMIDALPYLADYPYGCTEQTLNRFLPTVLTRKTLQTLGVSLEQLGEDHANLNAQQLGDGKERLAKRFGKNPIEDSAQVEKLAADGVKRLTEMQCADGGWGWFSGYGEFATPYLTALVVKGLFLARASDAAVDSNTLDRGIVWLETYLADETLKLLNGETWTDVQKEKQPRRWKSAADATDALVYFVLHEVGRRPGEPAVGTAGDAARDIAANLVRMKEYLWRDRAKLSLYADALYALALDAESQDANAERIALIVRMLRQHLIVDDENQTAYLDIQRADCWGGGWRWWSWYGNDIETQSAFLRLLVRTEPNGDLAPRLVKYLLNNRKNGTYWNSTRDTALCLEAFGEYLKATGETADAMTVEVLVDGEVKKTCAVTPENLLAIDNTLELTELTDGAHTVTLRRTGDGPLYWNAYLQNFTLEDRIQKTGLEVKIERRFWLLTEETDATTAVAGGHGQAVSQRVKKWKRTAIDDLSSVASGEQVEVELLIESKNDYDSLLIEDHKAAGFEPVDLTSGYNGNELGAYVEFRDDRVSFFVKNLDRGNRTLTYRLRAETPGQFSALPATILGMYAPELAGNSDEMKIGVTERK